jgi:C-terminal processing protease CtpA/Prc
MKKQNGALRQLFMTSLLVLINEGSRSGKEIIALLKEKKRPGAQTLLVM